MKRPVLLLAAALPLSLVIPFAIGGWDALSELRNIPLWIIAAGVGLVSMGWISQAIKLKLIMRGVGESISLRKALATVLASEFASSATPAGTGAAITETYLLHRHGLSSAKAASVFALEQILDLFFFVTALVVLAIVLLTGPQDFHLGFQIATMGLLLLGGFVGLWFFARHYRPVLLWTGRLLERLNVSAKRRKLIARWVIRFRNGLSMILSFSRWRLSTIYMLAATHWLLRYSALFLIIEALGQHVPWSYLFFIQMFSLGIGQMTLLPGGSGSVEISFSILLAPWLGASTIAATLIAWRFVTYYWYFIVGGPVFLVFAGKALWRRISAPSAA